jgi:hypothetical protein
MMERTAARRWSPWDEAGGLLALAAAVGLWAAVLAGVAAPLGGAHARLDARTPPAAPACATPPGALASAAQPRPRPAGPCP